MYIPARARLRRATSVLLCATAAGFLAACTSTQPNATESVKKRSKEYFSETEYGVKASPRVSMKKANLPRGGGRDQIGKPYKVRGKVYYPKEEKNYKKTGLASWYGDAFHGRLTANGEIYDMTHLTAAHPTMPLPSYARVTNMENGSSVIVRVNDRGPYSHNRLIDLSKRAAEMLDYTHSGTAKVKVEYVGRAPLDGHDDEYLMASYRPGNRAPDPSDGLPTGVMIAMNGPTPSTDVGQPGRQLDMMATGTSSVTLPAVGPIAPERPAFDGGGEVQLAMASLSYADEKAGKAGGALSAFGVLTSDTIASSWKRMNDDLVPAGEAYVAAASFTDAEAADSLARALSAYGRPDIEKTEIDGIMWYSVNLRSNGQPIDSLLQAAWSHGAPDAIVIRD
ncbi:MAG: septal ring lytic transglycosylase RlpA family protein [Rhizobiaceae bacterium]|nr:septal ring lytic transglycosylase RlpA family protein [Rhizobiaceae bacterium]